MPAATLPQTAPPADVDKDTDLYAADVAEETDLDADGVAREHEARLAALAEASLLAERQLALEASVAELEQRLAAVKGQLQTVSAVALPGALTRAGLRSLDLASGHCVTLKEVLQASITEEKRQAAHAALRAAGHGDLIKRQVQVSFGKGEEEACQQLLELLTSSTLRSQPITQREAVHPQTLGAFVRDCRKRGVDVPEGIDVFEAQVAKITAPARRPADAI